MSDSRTTKPRALPLVLLLLSLLLIVLAAAGIYLALLPRTEPAPALDAALAALLPPSEASLPGVDGEIARAAVRCLDLRRDGELTEHFRSASGTVVLRFLDPSLLGADLAPDMQALLVETAARARRRAELYTEDGGFQPALTESLYTAAVAARLSRAEHFCREERIPVSLRYDRDGWTLEDAAALEARLSAPLPSMPGYAEALAALRPVAFHYTLPDRTSPGPVPDAACFGESTDPWEIAALLETEPARTLIAGQPLDFDPTRDMLGRPIRYYLDETILAIVWQQVEHGAIGTFAEVFLADASQLRRKLADDSFGSAGLYYPSELAAQANAVVAVSGDFYNSGRGAYGLSVYDGRLLRSCLYAGQSCLFTDEGDMLFVYENAFADEAEAQRFVEEHRVGFSLSFGPVLIDGGADVTPYDYPLGEVRDTYARCAVGQLGRLHYLAMTINVEVPEHNVYVTLRQAADSMIAHGCVNAYTLDGGQTGSILIGGRLINPVQFGAERRMSDIFYFATAIPSD